MLNNVLLFERDTVLVYYHWNIISDSQINLVRSKQSPEQQQKIPGSTGAHLQGPWFKNKNKNKTNKQTKKHHRHIFDGVKSLIRILVRIQKEKGSAWVMMSLAIITITWKWSDIINTINTAGLSLVWAYTPFQVYSGREEDNDIGASMCAT